MFEQYSVAETMDKLKSDGHAGLKLREAGERLRRDGRNEMKAPRRKTPIESFLEQLNDPLIYVLIVAAAVSVLLKEISDAVIIGVVVALNALVGMLQEGKARRALESLKKLTSPRACVIREGRRMEIPAAELVKGDLVLLEAGCQVPADMRLTESSNLKIEESALTGESLPMEKDAGFVGEKGRELPPGDRRNMAYMSTIVTYGRGRGVVTAVGMDTELGQIAAMITEAKEEMTPLQRRLGELGKVLSLLSLLLCAALFVIAVMQRRNVPEMLITAISLAGGRARRTSSGGDHLSGAERHPHGEGEHHCQASAVGGDPGGGERGVLGQNRNPDPEPYDGRKMLAGRQDTENSRVRPESVP